LPAEHYELMSQHEQLDVFVELAAPASDQQPQNSREREISEGEKHPPMLPEPTSGSGETWNLGFETPHAPTRVPYGTRQVPEWLRKIVPPSVTAIVYGGMLGLGFATRYTYSAHTAMVVGAAFMEYQTIIAVSVLFASGKSVVVVATPRAPIREIEEAFDRRFRIRRYGETILRGANVGISCIVGFALVLSIVGG